VCLTPPLTNWVATVAPSAAARHAPHFDTYTFLVLACGLLQRHIVRRDHGCDDLSPDVTTAKPLRESPPCRSSCPLVSLR
jgi:hypothetical protein